MARRTAWILGLAAPLAASAQSSRVRVSLPGFLQPIVLDSAAAVSQQSAPMGATYTAVVAAFESLGIPMEVRDSAGGLVANLRLTGMRRLAGAPMSRYVNCGLGLTGPNADSFKIFYAIAAILDPLPGNRTQLRVALAASARDVTGNASDPLTCGTTGAFEERIGQLVASLLSGRTGG